MLLLLTPANSGSTAIAEFLSQADGVFGLTPRFEGQWLLPTLSNDNRWREDHRIEDVEIARVWKRRIRAISRHATEIRYIVEKSPPNMMRHSQILRIMPKVRVVVNNRNPFAQVASSGFRYKEFSALDPESRLEECLARVDVWLDRSKRLRDISQEHGYPTLTYERFCEAPLSIFEAFGFDDETVKRQSISAEVSVKDYAPQQVTNMNPSQIRKLSSMELDRMSKRLDAHKDVLSFFGYSHDPEET